MIRHLVCVLGILFGALLWANAQSGPDDKYVFIYSLIQEADGLKQKGDGKAAADRYAQAEKTLKDLKALYPDWNKKIVDYRLELPGGPGCRNLHNSRAAPAARGPRSSRHARRRTRPS